MVRRCLPFSFPTDMVNVVLLLLYLLAKFLGVRRIRRGTSFLLKGVTFFFMPTKMDVVGCFSVLGDAILRLLMVYIMSAVMAFTIATCMIALAIGLVRGGGKKGGT